MEESLTSVTEPYKILDWDSAFFGYKVAMLLEPSFNYNGLSNGLQKLKEENVKLVYWSPAKRSIENGDEQKIASLGGKLVDIKTVYEISLDGKSADEFKRDERVKEYTDTVMHPDLVGLAFETGVYSRYKVDERIGRQKFEELYTIWMEQSVEKKIAKAILVTVEEKRITGMITLGERDGSGNSGLMAVDPAQRGKGLGYALFQEMFRWFIEHGYKKIRLVTQEANVSACNFYERAGFEKVSAQPFYHFWI
ncbi:MAG TPA: GNAT family N-acetyltransferase [Bacteroidia bacterium]|nr:GNAT family N-acetyltransferase [Bacteroidia bacterium]